MLALKTFRTFVEKWPEHPEVEEIRGLIADLETEVEACLTDLKLPHTPDGFEDAVVHEQAQLHLSRGDFQAARDVNERLLATRPNLVAARNNLSLACFLAGDLEEAIAQCHQVPEQEADNVHVQANLIRYLYVSGDVDGAKAIVPQLLSNNTTDVVGCSAPHNTALKYKSA